MEAGYLWLFLGELAFAFGFPLLVAVNLRDDFRHKYLSVFIVLLIGVGVLNFIAMCYLFVFWRLVSRPLIGRFGRCAVDAFFVCCALIQREYSEKDVHHRIILVSIPLYLHALAHLMHFAPDMGLVDVLLELFLEVIVYETSKDIYNTLVVLVFCGIVTLFRCWSYSPPTKPLNVSKKLEDDEGDVPTDRSDQMQKC